MDIKQLIQRVSSYSDANAEPILTTAYNTASDAHEGLPRYNGEPFINHPFAVANILAEWFAPPPVVAAGLLHDVLNAKYSQGEGLTYFQGKLEPEVFHLLEATSSLNSFFRRFEDDFGIGTNANLEVDFGREFNANVILHEAPLFVQERDAFIIKIADQLHNLQTISYVSRERQKRAAYFALNIFAPLADRLGMGVVKRQLEDNSFRIINPVHYEFLQHQCGEAGLELQKNGIVNQLQEELTPLMLKIEVRWSPFSLYAIYHRQLEKQARYSHLLHEGLIKLEDSGSFIVMTEDELDCFHLLRRLHKLYPPVDHQLRDLIYHRNPNGYQSLHTQVKYPTGHLVNLNIRTFTMDLVAEYGSTAGWRGVPEDYLPKLPADVRPTDSEIQVYTPKGEVKYLPSAATPLDFAYEVHTDVGDHCIGALVNGEPVDLYSQLHNDATVEILVGDEAKPSPEWLNHVHTYHASNRIRHWLMHQNRNAMEVRGRSLLEKELQAQDQLSISVEVDRLLKQLAIEENLEGPEDLLASLGVGQRKASKLIEQLKSIQSSKFEQPMLKVRVISPDIPSSIPKEFRKCCQPTPPYDIVGYYRKNNVLSIHKTNCAHIKKIKKLIQVEWETTLPEPDYVLSVKSLNSTGLASDLSNVMARLDVDMLHFDSQQSTDGVSAETLIYLGDTTLLQRNRIQKELDNVPFVKKVEIIHVTTTPIPSYQPNPYGPNPAIGPRFYGRDSECLRIAALLREASQNSAILLWGQKRIGKTSLLLRLEELARGDYLPVYIDLQGLAYYTTTQFLHHLIHHISQHLKAAMPDLSREITEPHFNRLKVDPLGLFDRFMERVQTAFQYRSLVVILDEFQFLRDLREETVSLTDLINHLCSLSQHGHGVHLILSGGGLLSQLTAQLGLPSLLDIAYDEKLGCLGEQASGRLIKDGLSQVSEVDEDAVNLLLRVTAGHPYYLQLLCYRLFEQAREGTTAITYETIFQTIDEWLSTTEESRFLHLWDGKESADARRNKVILSAIAQLGRENQEVEYDHIFAAVRSIVQERDLVRLLEDLVAMGVLKHNQLHYALEVDLCALWLRQHWPLSLALKEANFS